MNKYYTYIYLDPRKPGKFKYKEYQFDFEPFYVGQGTGYRWKRHLDFKNKSSNRNFNLEKKEIILSILEDSLNPIILKVKDNISSEESILVEMELISLIGRIDNQTGTLTNKSNGGENCSEFKHSKEFIKTLYRPITQYDLYGNLIKEFESIKQASEDLNLLGNTIYQSCVGDIKIVKDKWIFLYSEDKFEKRIRNIKGYAVVREDIYGNKTEYKSITDAARINNIRLQEIHKICNGKRLSHGGYFWDYIDCDDSIKKIKNDIKKNYNIIPNRVIKRDENGNIINIYENIFIASLQTNQSLARLAKKIKGEYKNDGFEYEI